MPKTLNFSFLGKTGKPYHGVPADNHVVYNIFGGLPKYSIVLLSVGLVTGSAVTLSIQKIGNIIREKRQNNCIESSDDKPVD